MAKSKRYVIIGGGPAGVNAIETIRLYDKTGKITLISDEPPYARMVLPYYLAGEIPEKQVFTGDADYFKKLKTETLYGKRVIGVDAAAKALTLSGGKIVPFDKLLIATGSSATRPPIDGIDQDGVHNLWTLDDTKAVLKKVKRGGNSRVLFVGAGFIGFIVLNALHKVGAKLSVVETEKHVLPRMLNSDGAKHVERWLQKKGVSTHTGTSVTSISRNGELVATLSNGTNLPTDAVVIATGVAPQIGFLEGSGIKTNHGIIVNNKLQTNFRDIYAAGDAAEGPDLMESGRNVHAIQPTAVDHGRVAGANMAGKNVNYKGSLLMNILDVCGLQCSSFGRWSHTGKDDQVVSNDSRPIYRRLMWNKDVLVGAILMGRAEDLANLNDMGMVKGFIQTGCKLKHWKDYLAKNPLDIRRAYLASGAPQLLLKNTLLGKAATARKYRFKNTQPATKPLKPHGQLVKSFVAPKIEGAGGKH